MNTMMSKIHMVSGPLEGRSFEIEKDSLSIGRTADNDVQIQHPSVSRHHARITRQGDRFFIEDLKSQNGTKVNGLLVTPGEPLEIRDGSLISIADILFSLEEPYADEGMVTRYSISLTDGVKEGTAIYKDRRITNRRNLETIYEVSTTLMRSLDINEICGRTLDALFRCLPRIDSGAILLVAGQEAGGFKELLARTRDPKKAHEKGYSRTIVNRVIGEGRAVMMSDTALEAECDLSESIKLMRMKSIMCVPLAAQDRILGAVYVHSLGVSRAFRKDDLFFLTSLCIPAALAMQNALLYDGRKEAEDRLRKAHEDLEGRVQERTQELFQANQLLMGEVQERRRAEEELKKTNRFLESILDSSSSISIISTDIDQNVLFWNKGAENLFGFTAEEMIGRRKVDILYPDEETRKEVDRIREIVIKERKEAKAEIRETTRDGRELWFRLNLTPRFDEKGRVVGILGIGEDATQRKMLERDFVQAQKMEAVGTLAGGIAHDFNNLLMGIKGRTTLMLMETDPAHPHFESLNVIEECTRRAADLTSQLLGFARGSKFQLRAADLNEITRRSLDLFARTKKEVTTRADYQDGIWPVEVDANQIEQVLLNLYVNAWQAMPNGGILTVRTENVTIYENLVRSLGARAGRYVRVSVTDTGVGMDEETRDRVFEPFFTTKELGKGTGLGLASAYGIVKGHGGVIEVTSRKGEGTSFVIYLPASDKEIVGVEECPGELVGGAETVLVVDDEAVVLDTAKTMIEKLGYKVLTANGGRRALEIYRQHRTRIDLVVLDLIMPGLNGEETFVLLKNMDPGVRVLLSSGYSVDGRATDLLERGCGGFIQKPFSMKELSDKLREVLAP
ncbi:MAG: PAS domain S-box protein [Deltaproteobacteria bacterium]|nr:PAS domain S-box protein [Deltaproteobacteria bacterium]